MQCAPPDERRLGPFPPLGWVQGTFGTVLKCRNRETGEIVAIKKFKSRIDGENADAAQARGCWGWGCGSGGRSWVER